MYSTVTSTFDARTCHPSPSATSGQNQARVANSVSGGPYHDKTITLNSCRIVFPLLSLPGGKTMSTKEGREEVPESSERISRLYICED